MNLPAVIKRSLGAFGNWVGDWALGEPELGGRPHRWDRWALSPAPARQDLAQRHLNAVKGAFLAGTPIGASIISVYESSLVADGPSIASAHPNRAMRRTLEKAWRRWYPKADAEAIGDFAMVLSRVVGSLVVNGEAVVHMLTTRRGELQLKLLSAEQLDPTVNRPLPDGGQIVAGVEYDASGKRVAFWIRSIAPDTVLLYPTMLLPVRIPATEILHVFTPAFPGSVRGRSWLAPVAPTILDLHKLIDAMGARMNVAALFAGFITDTTEGGMAGFGDDARPTRDGAELSMEPGTMRVLPPGTDVKFTEVPGTEGADALIRHMIRSIASGVGLPPFLLDGDYGSINYSAGRLGLETFKRRVTAIRASLLGAQLLQPIWERFVTLEILSGRLNAPDFLAAADDYFAMAAQWPGFAALDPFREAQADVLLMNSCLRSRAEIVAARGRDVADVDAEIEGDALFTPDPTATFAQENSNVAA